MGNIQLTLHQDDSPPQLSIKLVEIRDLLRTSNVGLVEIIQRHREENFLKMFQYIADLGPVFRKPINANPDYKLTEVSISLVKNVVKS